MMPKLRTTHVEAVSRLAELLDVKAHSGPMVQQAQTGPRHHEVEGSCVGTSRDEPSQLMNVLTGEMSIVGLGSEEVRLINHYDEQGLAIRVEMKSGITGPMHVRGRGKFTFAETLECDARGSRELQLVP